MSSSDGLNLHIAGVPVNFPHTPYRAQLALMNAVVNAVKNNGHALVESPTGTGKSLALLCSSLALREKLKKDRVNEYERIQKEMMNKNDMNGGSLQAELNEKQEQVIRQSDDSSSKANTKSEVENYCQSQLKQSIQTAATETTNEQNGLNYCNPIADSDDDDFMPQRKLPDVSWQHPISKPRKRPAQEEEIPQNAFMLLASRHDTPLDPIQSPPSSPLPQSSSTTNPATTTTNNNTDINNRQHQPTITLESKVTTDSCAEGGGNAEIINGNGLASKEKDDNLNKKEKRKKEMKSVPRIFYATRTHSQVTQVIRELRKTIYRPSLCILASRREYCLNDAVRKLSTRDDACKRLNEDRACKYYPKAQELSNHSQLIDSAWDIEELTNLGGRVNGCPYYASHELYQKAILILCPYSFLLDPIIRSARGINVSGDIVILDEAHNIENYARDAASFETDVAMIRRGIGDFDTLILTTKMALRKLNHGRELLNSYKRLKVFLIALISMVESVVASNAFINHGNFENAVFEQSEMMNVLTEAGINYSEVTHWRAAHDFISQFGDGNEEERYEKLGMNRRPVIDINDDGDGGDDDDDDDVGHGYGEQSRNGYGYRADSLDNDDKKTENEDDYGSDGMPINTRRVKRGRFDGRGNRNRRGSRSKDNKRQGRRRGIPRNSRGDIGEENEDEKDNPYMAKCVSLCNSMLTTLHYLFDNENDFTLVIDRRTSNFVTAVTMNIQCLNAAVCFREISQRARSVIVTSGTLSPMTSFAGELGTKFAITKSLPHVIDVKKQLYLGVVGNGPPSVNSGGCISNRFRFEATFNGSAKFEFQDGLGQALLDYCSVIPGGVLIFFPSYRLMDLLCNRWKQMGVWRKLEEIKQAVLCEPTQRGEEFDQVLADYYALTSPVDTENGQVDAGDSGYGYGYGEDRDVNVGSSGVSRIRSSSGRGRGGRGGGEGGDGAVLMAVCRGKLSEGIDFKDETSRAVILIGIPYPYSYDINVLQKRKWNDRMRLQSKKSIDVNSNGDGGELFQLQSGSEWYEMQAFRALNQALGRAVRHRYDYGAIILIDARFRQDRVINQLPKWSRDALTKVNLNHETIVHELKQFYHDVQNHIADLANQRRLQSLSKQQSQQSSLPLSQPPVLTS